MLNELYQLSNAIERAGIKLKYWHPEFGKIPQGKCYRISLLHDGSISDISLIDDTLRKRLRKFETSNGNSFPGFNIQPLYRIADDDRKKQLKKWREGPSTFDPKILKMWCNEKANQNWDDKIQFKLENCLKSVPADMLQRIGSIPDDHDAISKLFNIVLKNDFYQKFQDELESYLWKQIEAGNQLSDLMPVLVYEGRKKLRAEKDRGKLSIFLEIQEWKNFPIMHEESISWINEQLVLFEENTIERVPRFDAFSCVSDGYIRTLPSVELPYLGDVTLRAMNSESRCQYRYRTIDAKSFPIGFESRKRAKSALEWMAKEALEGKTWGRADGKELIFAYPSILQQSPPKIASCFGARKADDSEARFAKYAEDVIDSLRGLASSLKEVELKVFSLRKMDKARTKVVFHRNYSAQRLADAAMEWRIGCENVPEIAIDAWGKQKGEIVRVKPETPFPLQIADCLNIIWKMEDSIKQREKTVKKDESSKPYLSRLNSKLTGIELMLDETAGQRLVPHLLSILIQNGRGLFCSLGQSINRDAVIKLDGLNKYKQLMPSILGLLLWKLGIGKETYMHKAPFLVGKMFKLADEIHALYCKEVRDNHLPPTLVGNSLLTAALETPVQALAQLALRIKPYYGWAQTFRGNENGGLAGYYIRLYGQAASELADFDLPSRFNDADRAQVFLGYLAANPRKQEK